MRRLIPLAAIVALLAAPSAFTASSATKLAGTTGPGLTITVKKAGAKVTKLRAGKYTLAVSDKSAAHNFVLNGPGIRNKQVTGLAFMGTKTVTVTLKKGRYEYYCTPHRSIGMHGFIRVT
jgi:plastocyanin